MTKLQPRNTSFIGTPPRQIWSAATEAEGRGGATAEAAEAVDLEGTEPIIFFTFTVSNVLGFF